jgi:hypothetical protein
MRAKPVVMEGHLAKLYLGERHLQACTPSALRSNNW